MELCLDHDPKYSRALTAANDALALRPAYWEAIRSEGDSFNVTEEPGVLDLDSAELDAARHDLGALDLLILTAEGKARYPGLPPAQRAGMAAHWKAGHDASAAQSRDGRNEMAPGSGHYIQFAQPQVVVAAVRDVVLRARALR